MRGGGTSCKRDLKWDIYRALLIICVVIGHSGYYSISTHFGGINFDAQMLQANISDTQIHSILNLIVRFLYAFHMPAFISLSGMMYAKQIAKGKWENTVHLIKSKFKSLILPCIFVWVVWNIPIKFIANYYQGVPIWMWFVQILFPENVYLWYLEALFFCFLFDKILSQNGKITKFLAVLVLWSTGIVVQHKLGGWTPLGNPFKWLLWFEVGMQLDMIVAFIKAKSIWKKANFIGSFILWLILFLIASQSSYKINFLLSNSIFPALGIMILTYSCEKLESTVEKSKALLRITNQIVRYGFAIYLWAEPLNYLIISETVSVFGIAILGNEIAAFGIACARTVVTPLIAVMLAKILKKANFPIKAY